MSKLNKKYFTLAPELRLHITPDFGYALSKDSVLSTTAVKALKKNSGLMVNHTGILFLKHADGTRTISEVVDICHSMLGNPEKDFSTKLMKFINQACKYNQIILHSNPMPSSVNITGREDMWFPVHAMLELTIDCNLKCIHCYRFSPTPDNVPDVEVFSTEDWIKVLEILHKNGMVTLEFSGGEPLLHPGFKRILNRALDFYPLIAIITNGTLVTDELCDYFAQHADQLLFSVSLDGSTEEIHDRIRGVKGAFKTTTTAIKKLVSRGLRVRAGVTFSLSNVFDFENIILLSKDLGCWSLAFGPAFPYGRGSTLDRNTSEDRTLEILEYIGATTKKYAGFLSLLEDHHIEMMNLVGNCGAAHRSVTIGPNGDIRPCPMMPTVGPVLGNILREKYEDIFSNPIIRNFRELPVPREEICGNCDRLGFCKFCSLRGAYTYANLKKDCIWARTHNIDQWLDISSFVDPYVKPEDVSVEMLDLGKSGCEE